MTFFGAPLTVTVEPLGTLPQEGFRVSAGGQTRFVGDATEPFDAFQLVCFGIAVPL